MWKNPCDDGIPLRFRFAKFSYRKPPQFLRIEDFGETAMIVKILGETRPLKQPEVTGELRKRIKIAFDSNGIEMSSHLHEAKGRRYESLPPHQ